MHRVQCKSLTLHCTLYNVQCTVYIVHISLYTVPIILKVLQLKDIIYYFKSTQIEQYYLLF